ncbi:MAG: nucleoside-diphosphate sugar epimerase/dehydratase [Clostridia bacterium]|nr:nucleoside-diphosphate sugar epimerase/dehydratase [Clostridia bacterium]
MIPRSWRISQVRYLLLDSAALMAADMIGLLVRFDGVVPPGMAQSCMRAWPATLPVRILAMSVFGMYQRLWKYASVRDMMAVAAGVTSSYVADLIVIAVWPAALSSRGALLISYLFAMALIGLSRFRVRLMAEISRNHQSNGSNGSNGNGRRVAIVGAGSAGSMVAKELLAHPEMGLTAVGFIDDDPDKCGGVLNSLPVLGTRDQMARIIEQRRVNEVIVAMPSAPGTVIREIMDACRDLKVRIKTLPGVYELVDGKVSVKQLRDIQIEDLLGREPVQLNLNEIGAYLRGQKVLVTGAGGSIGSEICRQAARFEPQYIVLLGHGENSIFEIEQDLKRKFPRLKTFPVIADIRDASRIDMVFERYKPSVVFHAAAHKHVPLMEANPKEALTNNVFGTRNVATAADKHGARRFVMISTDKAVNPVSVMGMSKRAAEMVVQAIGTESKTKFMAVRFGNVLGSRGSVVPIFRRQIAEGGPVTVTHPDMTRYFMTIPEAVQLVMQAGAMGQGGEVFILDMGEPVKIVELAEQIIRLSGCEPGEDIKIEYTGTRPGERLFEEILTTAERAMSTKHTQIFVSREDPPEPARIRTWAEELQDDLGRLDPEGVGVVLQAVLAEQGMQAAQDSVG